MVLDGNGYTTNRYRLSMKKASYKERPKTHTCTDCNINLLFDNNNFNKCSRRKFGLEYKCKKCQRKLKQLNNSKNKDARYARISKEYYIRKQNGVCTVCARPPINKAQSFCKKHYLQNTSHNCIGTKTKWEELDTLLLSQNSKCIYTGEELILGYNASIDHIKPIAKYPEERKNFNNLQWVTLTVNRMKRDLEEDEFITLCKKISSKV